MYGNQQPISLTFGIPPKVGSLKMFATTIFNLQQAPASLIALAPTQQQQTKPVTLQVSVGVQTVGHHSPSSRMIRSALAHAFQSKKLVVGDKPPHAVCVELLQLLVAIYEGADIHVQVVSDAEGDGAMMVYEN